ncbi:hypothetical protein RCJ22_19060, partial [Vibrio sp. FNV 38]|nr:hypothetical protein [Vibrio sp. FNV 38]
MKHLLFALCALILVGCGSGTSSTPDEPSETHCSKGNLIDETGLEQYKFKNGNNCTDRMEIASFHSEGAINLVTRRDGSYVNYSIGPDTAGIDGFIAYVQEVSYTHIYGEDIIDVDDPVDGQYVIYSDEENFSLILNDYD